ncbi:hypothetical protein [Endozoicomonas sp. SCSIO W0465]|uniref:hypothetical protein n=1 Tax=Endozoicomonas sp. SCSIO W0465 TaxID=2918516 RepID=UPI0020756FE7|nr:hypothetical protein [Endozoicomonas sp. SCSIO W0465]USE35474.1 hypothetical protein MJO57_25810 [Endozoicomonas sp. SCSIO W0465]
MDRLPHSTYFNAAINHVSYFQDANLQDANLSKSVTLCQKSSRDVIEVANILCAMRRNKNVLQQQTVPFHGPFNNPALEKRSTVIVHNHPEDDQPFNLSVRREPVNCDQIPTYIPDNESFSIQSILGIEQSTSQSPSLVDNNLHQSVETSLRDRIDSFTRPAAAVAIVRPQVISVGLQQYNIPAGCEIDPSSNLTSVRVEETAESSTSQIERKRERQRERQRERNRERRKDPAFAERERERNRERNRELRKDPTYVERERACKREHQRKRYHSDPAYADGQRIYSKIYNRTKKQTSNKEEAAKQAKIAREEYFQSVSSAGNPGELTLTSNLVEAIQSSSQSSNNNLDSAPTARCKLTSSQ